MSYQFIKEKTKCKQVNKSPITFANLNFIKCMFFTNEQYNTNKIHVPKQSLYLENISYISTTIDVENIVNNLLDNVFDKLNEGNTSGRKFKIPMPIFVMIGRKLDFSESIFDNESFKHVPTTIYPNTYKYGNATIATDNSGNLAILNYINAFFNSGLETESDKNKYNSSLANRYAFKGNVKISIYIPYLTNKYKYVSNFVDIVNSSKFIYTLINNDNFLSMQRTTNLNVDEYRDKLKKAGMNDRNIEMIINLIRNADYRKFPLYDDLYNMCYDGGCISDGGEDYEALLPQYSEDDGKNNENAIKFSPFMPNKCLSKTNGYLCNIQYAADHNINLTSFLKKYSLKELKESLNKYSQTNYDLNNNNNNQDPDEIDKYKSPVDLINTILNRIVKDGYSANLNDGGNDNYRYNHYSKKYSENIIKELMILNKIYPGVPEITSSMYLFNDNYKTDKIIYMPWGKYLISPDYVINIGDILAINGKIFSYNNRFALTIDNNGFIYVYDVNSRYIIYFLNLKVITNPKGLIVESNGLTVNYLNSNNNLSSIQIINNKIDLINNCEDCKEPFSLLLDNNTGEIIIYGNSFLNVTHKNFSNFINTSKSNILKSGRNISVDSLNNFKSSKNKLSDNGFDIDENGELKILNKGQYTYCDSTKDSCLR